MTTSSAKCKLFNDRISIITTAAGNILNIGADPGWSYQGIDTRKKSDTETEIAVNIMSGNTTGTITADP
jgi:hypothetical protein